MENLFTIIAVILVAGWALGYLGFREVVGNLIHLLLILAVISLIFQFLG